MTRYRSRYHRPRGLRNFRGDVFVFGDKFVRLFGFTVSVTCIVVLIGDDDGGDCDILFIQCFCGGKSFSDIFCTQTSGCKFRSIAVSFSDGDRKNFERVDMFLSVRSKMLVVVVLVVVGVGVGVVGVGVVAAATAIFVK